MKKKIVVVKDKKVTPEMVEFIKRNPDYTVSQLSEKFGVTPNKIYYSVKKNNLKVKKRESTIDKFLKTL